MRTRLVLNRDLPEAASEDPIFEAHPADLQAQIDQVSLEDSDDATSFLILWDGVGTTWAGSPTAIARLEPLADDAPT